MASLAMVASCACGITADAGDEFAGNVTFPKAAELREAGAKTPGEAELRAQSEYVRDAFRRTLPYLEKATTLFGEHDALPESKWFGRDQVSNRADINELLDSTIKVLGVSEVGDCRGRIREIEDRIEGANASISEYREKRISAPRAVESTSRIDRYNPFYSTKEDYVKLITEAETQIAEDEEETARLRREFGESLRATGIEVSDEAADSLLETVSGDDFISMCVIFDNLKLIALLLHKLTDEGNENPETAKRYYGMYVIIAKVLDRVQTQYVQTIRTRYIPELDRLAKKAGSNISEARTLIRSERGDKDALGSNIAANTVTINAANYYVDYLEEMGELIEQQHDETQQILATAINTYKTVNVSVNVSELIINGSKSLDRLMKLRMPKLRAFNNEILRKEYQRLNARIRNAS